MATISNGAIAINSNTGYINLATKASPKVVEAFARESATEGIFSQDYDWTGVRTVRVYSVDDLPLNDYNQIAVDGSSRFGSLTELGDTIQELTVNQDKAFNGAIDKGNNTSVLMIKAAGKVLNRQMRNVIIPYVDKYRLLTMATWSADSGATVPLDFTGAATAFNAANIVESIMSANALMSNQLVPDNNRVLYMGYTQAVNLKLASQVVGIDKLGEQAIVNGVMGKIDKCQVRLVPDSWMPANVKFMIVSKGCAVAPKKIETYRVIGNSYLLDGSLVQGRLLHDCFVLNKKVKGILVAHVTGTTPGVTATATTT